MDTETPLVAGEQSTRTSRMCDFSAPIIAVTARTSDGEKKRALAAGCNNVLEKPMTRATLLSVLSKALAPTVTKDAHGRGRTDLIGKEEGENRI